jgi:hypothetical protein
MMEMGKEASRNISGASAKEEEHPNFHGFLVLGEKELCLCHLAMFSMPDHRYQVILQADLPANDMETYRKVRKEIPDKPLIVMNNEEKLLKELVNSGSYSAYVSFADDDGNPIGEKVIESTTVTIKKILLFKKLDSTGDDYPENFTYYLYGTDSEEYHLSHMLTKAPNFQQELDVTVASGVLNMPGKLQEILTGSHSKPVIISIGGPEKSKQPIKEDPLTKSEYDWQISTGAHAFPIVKIIKRFWINNISLNKGFMDGMEGMEHRKHMDSHTHETA